MANINVRVPEELKNEASELFDDLGLNLSSAITVFLKQSVRENKLPFEVKRNKETDQAFLEVENNDLKTFKSVDEFWQNLNAD